MALPSDLIYCLKLPKVDDQGVILADGTTAAMEKFLVKVKWHEEQRSVFALRTDGDPISGMFLLLGSRITIDVVEYGDVTIDTHLLIL